MIKYIINSVFSSFYKQIDSFLEKPWENQLQTFNYLISHGKDTLFGQNNNFDKIKTPEDYKKHVPIMGYDDLKIFLDKIIVERKPNVLWDTPVKWFAMSSGTTNDKSKYIPVTKESLKNNHFRSGNHMLALYAKHNPKNALMFGKALVLGGSQQVNNIGGGIFTGDISAILVKNLPWWAKKRRTPEEITLISEWDVKLQELTDYAINQDIRSLFGVPSWMLVLLKKIKADTGKDISELWPNLEVFFHGGVSFLPYKGQYEKIISSNKMHYWETYNASEGFFGIQYALNSPDLLLLLDNEIFYEFIPNGEWTKENPQTLTLNEVEVGVKYAMVISTSGGLWRYLIGDTIEFTSLQPHLFRITGRTKHFINAFGEELMIDNAENALRQACKATGAKITEYTAGPVFFDDNNNGAHEWLIEFETLPTCLELFAHKLDTSLKSLNSDYEAKRSFDLSLRKPIIKILPSNFFYEWMESREKMGGQNKVPRLSNNREYVDSILKFLSESTKIE
ncbi:MAG: GH3 auxin-responsive promoter family protein [Dysgonamonadaceae bacterium]|nr:GH3 auxin-responsive promoter family protein [Dysgonamonadaceae bacterium]